jgi:trk system potassium uptake protein TrkA
MKKQIAVFGLGHFGGHLVNEFNSMGVDVLAIDKSQDRVDDFASIVTHAVACDATIESNLISLGVKNFDFAIVSFG